jgi:hypothetical protein
MIARKRRKGWFKLDATHRHFYHSFPRNPRAESSDRIIENGMLILSNIRDLGLVLAPEKVEWSQATLDGGARKIEIMQKRVSFTELARDELPAHSMTFGPFALEFDIATLRHIGAMPVSYMPQHINEDGSLSGAASSIVAQFTDAKYTINQLRRLYDWINTIRQHNPPELIKSIPIILTNVDDNGNIVQHAVVPTEHIESILKFLGYKNAPFSLMDETLEGLASLFYLTDNPRQDEPLTYYRQREWRLIPGIARNAMVSSRRLSETEKDRVILVDPTWWTRPLTYKNESFRRIDKTDVIDRYEGKSIIELARSVIVPADALEDARRLLPGYLNRSTQEGKQIKRPWGSGIPHPQAGTGLPTPGTP